MKNIVGLKFAFLFILVWISTPLYSQNSGGGSNNSFICLHCNDAEDAFHFAHNSDMPIGDTWSITNPGHGITWSVYRINHITYAVQTISGGGGSDSGGPGGGGGAGGGGAGGGSGGGIFRPGCGLLEVCDENPY